MAKPRIRYGIAATSRGAAFRALAAAQRQQIALRRGVPRALAAAQRQIKGENE